MVFFSVSHFSRVCVASPPPPAGWTVSLAGFHFPFLSACRLDSPNAMLSCLHHTSACWLPHGGRRKAAYQMCSTTAHAQAASLEGLLCPLLDSACHLRPLRPHLWPSTTAHSSQPPCLFCHAHSRRWCPHRQPESWRWPLCKTSYSGLAAQQGCLARLLWPC